MNDRIEKRVELKMPVSWVCRALTAPMKNIESYVAKQNASR